MQKTLFEWVVVMSDGTEYILTENQYKLYKESWRDGKIFFKDFEINPSFVSQAYRRPADELKKLYPCKNCFSAGLLQDGSVCPKCEGTGVMLPK